VSFIDTNILVYSTARGAPFRDQARAALSRLAADEPLSLSRQILREYMAVMTREQIWGKALTLAEATVDAVTFARRFTALEDGPPVWDQLVELSRRYFLRVSSGTRRQYRRDHAGPRRAPAADLQ